LLSPHYLPEAEETVGAPPQGRRTPHRQPNSQSPAAEEVHIPRHQAGNPTTPPTHQAAEGARDHQREVQPPSRMPPLGSRGGGGGGRDPKEQRDARRRGVEPHVTPTGGGRDSARSWRSRSGTVPEGATWIPPAAARARQGARGARAARRPKGKRDAPARSPRRRSRVAKSGPEGPDPARGRDHQDTARFGAVGREKGRREREKGRRHTEPAAAQSRAAAAARTVAATAAAGHQRQLGVGGCAAVGFAPRAAWRSDVGRGGRPPSCLKN
jgi:hypothetical protein